ncbi:MAG: prepilin-type N-terminal cleavage/methylation domain-containing protein [Clostridia bacterium]
MIKRKGFSLIEVLVYMSMLSIVMLTIIQIYNIFYKTTENVSFYSEYSTLNILKSDLIYDISNNESLFVEQNKLMIITQDEINILEIYNHKLFKNNEYIIDVESGYFFEQDEIIYVCLQTKQVSVNFSVFVGGGYG